jgi:tRNA A37 threonylcarbamoyladenosine dehydratase
MERFSRTQLLIGADGLQKLHNAKVAVFGVGGVGGYVVEALARSGIGGLTLIDPDRVSQSNINRQIIALSSTVGQYKTHAAKARVLDISPDCKVETLEIFYSPDVTDFDFSSFDYVVDAVDTVSAKLAIIERAKSANVPVISSMGAGNKLDPTLFELSDIAKTSVCPLARVMRRELKKRGIDHVKVVYSKEEPQPAKAVDEASGKAIPASIAFVPSVVGLIIAAEVIKDLIK